MSDDTAVFRTAVDGSLAAALAFHQRDFESVQAAYRAGDAVGLARAIENSPLKAAFDLTGLADELAGVRKKWWSVLADSFRFRHVRGPAPAQQR